MQKKFHDLQKQKVQVENCGFHQWSNVVSLGKEILLDVYSSELLFRNMVHFGKRQIYSKTGPIIIKHENILSGDGL